MLRIFQCRSAAAAQTYYTQGLAREDYYTEGQEIAGHWGGEAALALGLSGEVGRDAFVALTDNINPATGERLTLRTRTDRTVGYDVNFHAPKGLSLLQGLHRDPRIVEAFRNAVGATMREMERDVATRVRKGGRQEDRVTGNLVWAEFVHLTARPTEAAAGPDPHLHAHCFVMNATFDADEQAWKAGQFQPLVRDAPYYEAAFHARLAAGLQQLGYSVDRTDTGWDVAGVPRTLVEKYSTRSKEIEDYIAEKGISDPVAKAEVAARTRQAKAKDTSLGDLRAAWDARLTSSERDLMIRIASGGGPAGLPDPGEGEDGERTRVQAAERALEWAVEHCFEKRSSLPLRRLVAEALKVGVGQVRVEDIWEAVPKLELLSREVNGQTLVTTRSVIDEERAVLKYAVEGKGVCSTFRESLVQLTGKDWTIKDQRLGEDQRRAFDHVLDSKDRVIAIRGAAGVGKTTMMTEAIDALRASGRSVMVVAPTADAARGEGSLREKGFTGAETVARLLTDTKMQEGLRNRFGGGVLWVDEAGLLGVGTMKQIFELAEKHEARVVLCGDAKQHKPVERGDALRILESLGGISAAEITTIRRQTGIYRDAVAALSEGNFEKGIESLVKLDAFREIEERQARVRTAAADYVDTIRSGKSCLIVSPTHAEGREVAAEVRCLQREQGLLKGDDREFTRLRNLDWSEAARGDPKSYRVGLVAHFHQGAKGVIAGDQCRIAGTVKNDKGEEVVRGVTPRGVEIDLPIGDADRFNVYEAEKIRLAVGDRIRITRNGKTVDKRIGVTNGAAHTITGFTKNGAMELDGFKPGDNPKVLPVNFGHIAYGSVRTSHASQGKDVDRIIICMGSASFDASSEEQFYVSVSRGKLSLVIYTDDKEALLEAIRRSAARLSGIELTSIGQMKEPRTQEDKDKGKSRQQDLARDIARRQAQEKTAKSPPSARTPPSPKPPPPPPSKNKKDRGRDGPEIERER